MAPGQARGRKRGLPGRPGLRGEGGVTGRAGGARARVAADLWGLRALLLLSLQGCTAPDRSH